METRGFEGLNERGDGIVFLAPHMPSRIGVGGKIPAGECAPRCMRYSLVLWRTIFTRVLKSAAMLRERTRTQALQDPLGQRSPEVDQRSAARIAAEWFAHNGNTFLGLELDLFLTRLSGFRPS
jgi:hypothetical protein